MTRPPAPRYRTAAKRRSTRRRPRRRPRILLIAIVLVAAVALAHGAWTLGTGLWKKRLAHESSATASAQAGKPERQTAVRHITFGAHMRADHPCASCHDGPEDEIACRSCHGDVCGKDAKTVSDCIRCHKKGTTDAWTDGRP